MNTTMAIATATATTTASDFSALSRLTPSHLPLCGPGLLNALYSDDGRDIEDASKGKSGKDDGSVINKNNKTHTYTSFFGILDPSPTTEEILSGLDLIARANIMGREYSTKLAAVYFFIFLFYWAVGSGGDWNTLSCFYLFLTPPGPLYIYPLLKGDHHILRHPSTLEEWYDFYNLMENLIELVEAHQGFLGQPISDKDHVIR